MPDQQSGNDDHQASSGQQFGVAAPQPSLPKGGGAVRGIGEKYAASPVAGTGSMSVPIATSPGHSGGTWVHDAHGDLVIHEDEINGYRVRRYRPRYPYPFF